MWRLHRHALLRLAFARSVAGKGSDEGHSDLVVDSTDGWLRRAASDAVQRGTASPKAAEQFTSMLDRMSPTVREALAATRDTIGPADASHLTAHQQSVILTKVTTASAESSSRELQTLLGAEESIRRHTETDEPTGEDFWFEATSLTSLDVPWFMKDMIMDDMKKGRRRNEAGVSAAELVSEEDKTLNEGMVALKTRQEEKTENSPEKLTDP